MESVELLKLRDEILVSIQSMALDSIGGGPEAFDVLYRAIQIGGGNLSIYRKAYEVANSIEDPQGKLDALMLLVDEINIDTESVESQEPAPEADGPSESQQ